jgi:hypothetical protein
MTAIEQAANVAGEWAARGACRTSDLSPAAWFPNPSDEAVIADAKAVCDSCPVWAECGTAAIEQGDRYGIRASHLLEAERAELARELGYGPGQLCSECGDLLEDGEAGPLCRACGKGFVSARSSQQAIVRLRGAGWSLRKITTAAGINAAAVLGIQRGEQRRVRAVTARRLEELAETIEAATS